ncbi:MAG: histidinol-phosphate transaminase [Bacteroidota bacterium]
MKKKINLTELVREHILNLKPYSSARDEYEGKVGIFLDANENPLGSVGGGHFNRYPDPLQREVKEKLASIKKVDPAQIFLGNGSDEAIDLLFRIFCEPRKDHVMLLPPTYGMYKVSADINLVSTVEIPLRDDFQLDTEEIVSSIMPGTKIIFICSPNNPTGNLMRKQSLELILQQASGLVVVDEAYIDFAEGESVLPLLKEYENLVVLQTFSKAWGLANLRLGMAFAHPDIIKLFNKVKPPYNVNGKTQELALGALGKEDQKKEMVQTILTQREVMEKELLELPMVEKTFPTHANFILVKVDKPNELYNILIDQQIIVRNRSRVTLCEGCLRITIGTEEENQSLIKALKALQTA